MSGMDDNPHYEGLARFNNRDLSIPEISYMHSQATLALAYEQRTANIIAFAQLCVSVDGPSVRLDDDFSTILARLGLNETKED